MMVYFWMILIPAVIIGLAYFTKGNVTLEDVEEYLNSRPPQEMPKLYEFGSSRERYLHRRDAEHERHRRNQWPL